MPWSALLSWFVRRDNTITKSLLSLHKFPSRKVLHSKIAKTLIPSAVMINRPALCTQNVENAFLELLKYASYIGEESPLIPSCNATKSRKFVMISTENVLIRRWYAIVTRRDFFRKKTTLAVNIRSRCNEQILLLVQPITCPTSLQPLHPIHSTRPVSP